jgi:hypothetical protein
MNVEYGYCQCGCGQKTNYNNKGIINNYIMGHWNRKPIAPRFYKNIVKTNSCWEWIGTRHGQGYGQIKSNGLTLKTHRVSWELYYGKIPEGLCVLHKCDNPCCVNPEHLFLGTYKDNAVDMGQKKRNKIFTGEDHRWSKLTSKDVEYIRSMQHVLYQKELALLFNVSRTCIQSIQYYKTWKHLLALSQIKKTLIK